LVLDGREWSVSHPGRFILRSGFPSSTHGIGGSETSDPVWNNHMSVISRLWRHITLRIPNMLPRLQQVPVPVKTVFSALLSLSQDSGGWRPKVSKEGGFKSCGLLRCVEFPKTAVPSFFKVKGVHEI